MNYLSPVSPKELIAEIGPEGLLNLQQLAGWLYPSEKKQFRGKGWLKGRIRMAPSLAARGIADFFDLSTPRFAFRVYLGAEHESFVNVLRISTLCNELPPWSAPSPGSRTHDGDSFLKFNPKSEPTSDRFRKNICIGDCFLTVPLDREGFTVVQTDLAKAHGEDLPTSGVPFTRSIRMSGLCAQAVCFMATALMYRHSKAVYSVPEITYLAQAKPDVPGLEKTAILVEGLTPQEIQHYFREIDLNSEIQSPTWMNLQRNCSPAELYRIASHAYLRSGFPTLLPVDLGRMAGHQVGADPQELGASKSIFARNGILLKRLEKPGPAIRDLRHVVLCVGFDAAGDLLINDPASLPFIKASIHQINHARPYTEGRGEAPPKPLLSPPYQFFSVTPGKVKVAILRPERGTARQSKSDEPCLLDFWRAASFSLNRSPEPFGEFLLARPDSERERIQRFLTQYISGTADGDIDSAPARFTDDLVSRFGDHWLWIQALPGHCEVLIWDAEKVPTKIDAWRQHYLGLWRFEIPEASPGSQVTHRLIDGAPASNEYFTQPKRRFPDSDRLQPLQIPPGTTPAVISSFSARGLGDWLKNGNQWPPHLGCDLYCFMNGDTSVLGDSWWKRVLQTTAQVPKTIRMRFRNGFRMLGLGFKGIKPRLPYRPRQKNIVQWMAQQGKLEQSIPESATRAAQQICRLFPKGSQIPEFMALSTFLPEICSSKDRVRGDAVAALKFLMHVGLNLNPRRCKDGLFTIEIVAGGLSNGIWPVQRANRDRDEMFVMNVRPVSTAMDCFIKSLRELEATALATNIRVSIECEPGPLYLLGTWKRLLSLCRELRRSGLGFVGLNVDIAHWAFLKKLRPSELPCNDEELDLLKSLIQSCHISDHADGGHFGDVVPGELHSLQEFNEWLSWIASPSHPRFTGLVSAELEACRKKEDLQSLFSRLTPL